MLLSGKKILVIEDDPDNLAVISAILRQSGAFVESDRWGKEALQHIHRFIPVDAIILDLMLPGDMSGYQIFDEIRAISGFESTPIIAVSAADSNRELPKARSKGFSGYIAKPVRYTNFASHIADIIAGQSIWIGN
jgi:CheY-like chemotaxis protein